MLRDAGGGRGASRAPARLAGFASRHAAVAVAASVLVVVTSAIFARDLFDVVKPFGFQDPDSESARAAQLYESATGVQPPPGVVALVATPSGIDDRVARTRIRAATARLEAVPGIGTVDEPAGRSDLVSPDRQTALVVGALEAGVEDPAAVGEAAQLALDQIEGVTAGGPAVAAHQINRQSEDDVRRIELVVAPLLLLICLWVFRGFVAALLPLVLGAFSILVALALLRAIAELVEIDVFSITVVTGLGLGLAIDYSLLIVSRYREELERTGPGAEAIERTLRTAGSTVAFSAVTVAVALAALLIFPQRFLYSSGIGGSLVALVSAGAALTVLPALLVLLGPRINSLAPPRFQRRGADRAVGAHHRPATAPSNWWYRVAGFALRRPLLVTTTAVVALGAATVPMLGIELTSADARVLPPARSAHQVDATIDREFAAGPTSPLLAVSARSPHGGGEPFPDATAHRLRAEEGVLRVRGPVKLDDRTEIVEIVARSDPLSDQRRALVQGIRSLDWPAPTLVAGSGAELADQRQSLANHLPLAVALVVSLTLLALLALTRSVVLPFAALLMNVLTIAAALGLVVFIFQAGRLEGLLGYMASGGIDISMPVLIVAVGFGVSTDYGVFLLARIRELRDAGEDARRAAVVGLARTGRVVTAAALLFAVAVGSFVGSELVMIKQGAVGIALAILIDATIVRTLLLPGLLGLLGERAWWSPLPAHRARPAIVDDVDEGPVG